MVIITEHNICSNYWEVRLEDDQLELVTVRVTVKIDGGCSVLIGMYDYESNRGTHTRTYAHVYTHTHSQLPFWCAMHSAGDW